MLEHFPRVVDLILSILTRPQHLALPNPNLESIPTSVILCIKIGVVWIQSQQFVLRIFSLDVENKLFWEKMGVYCELT